MENILNVYKILARSDDGQSYEYELCCDINDIQKSLNNHLNQKSLNNHLNKKGWTQYNYKVVRFEEVKTKLIYLGEINNE